MNDTAKILTSTNNKGGVGKSFILQLLASYAAGIRNLKVLAIDFDRQGNLSTRFINETKELKASYKPPIHPEYDSENPDSIIPGWDGYSDSATMYFRGQHLVPYPTEIDTLDILPANSKKMFSVERNEARIDIEKALDIPKSQLNPKQLKQDWDYDLVLIDTPPSLGIITLGAINAATHVLIPIEYAQKSLRGLNAMKSELEKLNSNKSKNEQTKLLGLVANKVHWNKRTNQRLVRNSIRDHHFFSKYLLKTEIRDCANADKVDTVGEDLMMPFTTLAGSNLSEDASKMCELVLTRMGL